MNGIDNPIAQAKRMALHRYREGAFNEAEGAARRLVELDVNDPSGWQLLGVLSRERGAVADSVRYLERACRLVPDSVDILDSLVTSLLTAGQYRKAELRLRQLIAKEGMSERTIDRLLVVQIQLDREDEALATAREGLVRYPDNYHITHGYSLLLKNRGELIESIGYAKRTLRLRAAHPSQIRQAKPRPDYNTAANLALLWSTLALLCRAGVHAFPTAGTLLGLVREQGLLPHDKDLDLGLPYAQMDAAAACLANHGWQAVKGMYRLINPRQFRHAQSGVVLDLCGLQREPGSGQTIGGFWMAGIPPEWNRITEFPLPVLRQFVSPVGQVWRLADEAQWLETLYGDWRTPDHHFDTVIRARNLRGFAPLTECYALHRIYLSWEQGNLDKALQLLRSTLAQLPGDELLTAVHDQIRQAVEEPRPNGAPTPARDRAG